jgi:glycosyltransferase involved in cell wall biosynthesis
MKKKKEKTLFVSGRELNYPRNNLIINALDKYYSIKEIGPYKKIVTKGNYLQIIMNSIVGTLKTIYHIRRDKYSFLVIGFLGQFIAPLLATFTKANIIFDFFISIWDTLTNDREKFGPHSFLGKIALNLDKSSCRSADLILVDTFTSRDYYHTQLSIPKEKMRVLYVGCNEKLFFPRDVKINENLILYYSSYMPLHGVDVVVKAAKILENSGLKFLIIGAGQEYQKIQSLEKELGSNNITFSPSLPLDELPNQIAKASICLGGHFGASEKAKRVIAGKTFQLLAMAKPTIVGDNKANRELLSNHQDAIFCQMNSPEELAQAISLLHENDNLRKRIGLHGYETFRQKASLEVLSETLYNYTTELPHYKN